MDVCRQFQQKHQTKSKTYNSQFSMGIESERSTLKRGFTKQKLGAASIKRFKVIEFDDSSNDESQQNPYKSKVSFRAKEVDSLEDQLERKKEKLFLTFKWTLLHDDFLRHELKQELNTFAQVLLYKFQKAEPNSVFVTTVDQKNGTFVTYDPDP